MSEDAQREFGRIWTSPYQLFPHRSLNSRSTLGPRSGSLLRIEFPRALELGKSSSASLKNIGYADLHPWVELGDESLQKQLELLARGQLTSLTERSIAMAQADADARARGENLLRDRLIPRSHFLLTALDEGAKKELNQARAQLFSTVKIKIGRDLQAEAKWLVAHQDLLSDFTLRLDANAKTGLVQIEDFLDRLPEALIKSIQFIEDPCIFHPVSWAQVAVRVPVAFDQAFRFENGWMEQDGEESDPGALLIKAGVTHLIWKSATQNRDAMLNLAVRGPFQIVATSYLDHPVGQMGAAFEASRLVTELRERRESQSNGPGNGRSSLFLKVPPNESPNESSSESSSKPSSESSNLKNSFGVADSPELDLEPPTISTICGLLSQTAYQSNEFTDEWGIGDGPEFRAAPGLGFGFDELLENRDWEELV